jgi:hypothetical protein
VKDCPTVFVATSKRFYKEAEQVVRRLRDCGLMVFHPYFHLDPVAIDSDPDRKSEVTLRHFQEIDGSDMLFAILTGGYIGCSVTIEVTYAYSRGKKIVASEVPSEYAVRPMVTMIRSADDFIAQFRALSE